MDGVEARPAAGNAIQHTVSVPEDAQGQPRRSPATAVRDGDAISEHEINWFVLLEMFFKSASSTARTVGFVWATVVLLGGFVSKLSATEFWLVTILSFFQAARIFGGDSNSDQNILYGILLPPRTSSGAAHTALPYRIFTRVMIFMEKPITPCCTPKWSHLLFCGKLLLLLAAIAIRLLRVISIAGSVALFVTHVVLRSSGHSSGAHDEDTNTRAALNLFYGLVLAQALLSYMVVVYTSSRSKLASDLRNRHGLPKLDDELLELYYAHVRRTCRKRGVARALQSTIIRFALESLTSAVHGVRGSGVKTLHVLMESTAWTDRKGAALKTRDSPEAMASLLWMAGLVSPDERPKRARAASILANLATAGLRVSGIPSAMPAICSLLEAVEEVVSDSAHTNLVLKGLEILEHLSLNADNLREICNSDQLMSIIVNFTSRDRLPSSTGLVDNQKVSTSLLVLSRLAGAIDNQGIMLRQVMLRNVRLMSNVRTILLRTPSTDRDLRLLAVQTIAGFSYDSESRDCTAARKMITPLLDIFCCSSPLLEAGKALAMLTTESRANCAAILEAHDDFQALCGMLFDEHRAASRATVASIFANLCAYSEPGSHGAMKAFITRSISEVLRRTSQMQNHATEDLEAFLGLGLQFAKWTSARDFAEALGNIGRESYTRKLISAVQENQNPGVIRFAIEQAIWMMQHEEELQCVEQFRRKGMEEALLQAQGTIARIDDYKLLSPNGPVLEHEEFLPSVAKRALKLIRNVQAA